MSELPAREETGSDGFELPEADGGLEAGPAGDGMPKKLVKGLTLHEPWYQREKPRAAEQRFCANGCLGAEVMHHCETCLRDLCEACGTKHESDDSTKRHVLKPYSEKKVWVLFSICIFACSWYS